MAIKINRREFIAGAAGGVAGVTILRSSRSVWSYQANERLNVAIVGVAGYAAAVAFTPAIHTYDNVGLVAMCDVDQRKVTPTYELWEQRAREWPGSDDEAKRKGAEHYVRLAENKPPLYEDYRRMLEEMDEQIDAVVVATPDHTHAVISAAALRSGKPVLAEKPLTISAHEGRALRRLAIKHQVATSMGTQGASTPGFRRGLEIVRQGVIGPVHEVHIWFARGGRAHHQPPQGMHDIPDPLNWNLWLAQVAWRDYHPGWIARNHWRDTGIGELGNFGPHSGNLAFMSLNVKELWDGEHSQQPIRIEAECSELNRLSFPRWEKIRWEVPARGELPPVTFTWHHGPDQDYAPGSRNHLAGLLRDRGAADEQLDDLLPYAGAMLVGSEGTLVSNSHNTDVTLLPQEKFEGVEQRQPQSIRVPQGGHYRDWVNACRGGELPLTNFEYAGAFSEFLTLGDVATQFPEQVLEFDPVTGQITNHSEANQALCYEYRQGWRL